MSRLPDNLRQFYIDRARLREAGRWNAAVEADLREQHGLVRKTRLSALPRKR